MVFFVAAFTTIFYSIEASAETAPARTLNFQGRLLRSTGAVVPDGHYNIQFKIYEGGNGAAVNNPDGTLKWTESYVNANASAGVRVKNGLFSVNLGSVTPFGTAIDWNASSIWLSMNIAGSSEACMAFGTAPCVADGEMLPMKQMTATPFAMNAGQLGGKTAENFLQLAQGVQTDPSNNTSSIFINKTGTGNLVQLQNNGTDVFSITNTGNIVLGGQNDHALSIGSAQTGLNGSNLTVHSGWGTSDPESRAGSLFLQGGGSGGSGGDVVITGGYGGEQYGSIYIGASDTSAIQIGNPNLSNGSQTIAIGNTNAAGGTSNVTVGSGGNASGGTTAIQSKDDTTVSTNGEQRARFSSKDDILYLGNADANGQASVATGFTIQGTSSTAVDVQGGSVNIVAGSATSGNANGGNITLSGGAGSGEGADGLVVISTPTFHTSTEDDSCLPGGDLAEESCEFTFASVNNSAVLIAGFSTTGQTAHLPDPAITTPGRIMYVSGADGSEEFSVRINEGDSAAQDIPMRQNTAATFLWNGFDWIVAGSLPTGSGSFNLASNGGAEIAGANPDEFPDSTWSSTGGNTNVTRNTGDYNSVATGKGSVKVETSYVQYSILNGVTNKLREPLQPHTTYTTSFLIRADYDTGSSISDLLVAYIGDAQITAFAQVSICTESQTVSTTQWTRITCSFTTDTADTITSANSVAIVQSGASDNVFYVDDLSVTLDSSGASNPEKPAALRLAQPVESPDLLALPRSPTAPQPDATSEELLGSMYYDIEKGKVQCYEAEGWGSCGTAPDTFVSLAPSFPGVVIDESKTSEATFATGFCSDSLDVNNSAENPVCGEGETRNYYELRATDTTAQESRSTLYVTHTLPENFKEFVPEATSIAARSLGAETQVNYQIYKNRDGELIACGAPTTASTGTTPWQEVLAQDDKDPAGCEFSPGDSILLKIELILPRKLSAEGTLAAYVSNINFVYRINN